MAPERLTIFLPVPSIHFHVNDSVLIENRGHWALGMAYVLVSKYRTSSVHSAMRVKCCFDPPMKRIKKANTSFVDFLSTKHMIKHLLCWTKHTVFDRNKICSIKHNQIDVQYLCQWTGSPSTFLYMSF